MSKQFIEAVTGIKGEVNHDLKPQITGISVSKLSSPEYDYDIHFVDTPGFDGGDGTAESEAEDMISKWMTRTYAINISVQRVVRNTYNRTDIRKIRWLVSSTFTAYQTTEWGDQRCRI